MHISARSFCTLKRDTIHALGYPKQRTLYPHHIPTSSIQKVILSGISAINVFVRPERADMLAVLGEVTAASSLKRMHAKMCSDPVGIQILSERPSIRSTCIDINALRSLSPDTFGYHYAQFMDKHRFSADGRACVQFIDDPELAYVMQRYRELHDFWHTLFQIPPTVFGELVLKYVELVQTQLPVCALSGLVGQWRLSSAQRQKLSNVYVPYAYRAGKQARNLMNVYYENEFGTRIQDLRERLGIQTAPKFD